VPIFFWERACKSVHQLWSVWPCRALWDVLVLDAHLDLRDEYGCAEQRHARRQPQNPGKDVSKASASMGIHSSA
jgi:hypothetical protein